MSAEKKRLKYHPVTVERKYDMTMPIQCENSDSVLNDIPFYKSNYQQTFRTLTTPLMQI